MGSLRYRKPKNAITAIKKAKKSKPLSVGNNTWLINTTARFNITPTTAAVIDASALLSLIFPLSLSI